MNTLSLSVIIGDDTRTISVTASMLEEGKSIFSGMDRDLDKGWQLDRRFIESPNKIQRCQIAGARLLTALHTQNEATMSLMAAYILSRLPGVQTIVLNTQGENEESLFYDFNNALIS